PLSWYSSSLPIAGSSSTIMILIAMADLSLVLVLRCCCWLRIVCRTPVCWRPAVTEGPSPMVSFLEGMDPLDPSSRCIQISVLRQGSFLRYTVVGLFLKGGPLRLPLFSSFEILDVECVDRPVAHHRCRAAVFGQPAECQPGVGAAKPA